MTTLPLPPITELRKSFRYNPDNGDIVSLPSETLKPPNSRGYLRLHHNGRVLQGHRVAWALYHGEPPDPSFEIDHINGNPSDNRISNLRLVTQLENLRNKNKYKNCKHGYSGIICEKNRVKCWRAQIGVNGGIEKLGSFRCKTAAIVARKQGEVKYGFTGRSGDKKWQV